jgi:hypothetical protein
VNSEFERDLRVVCAGEATCFDLRTSIVAKIPHVPIIAKEFCKEFCEKFCR